MIGIFHTRTCWGGATIDLEGGGKITLPVLESYPAGFKDNDRVKITLKINDKTRLAEWDMEHLNENKKQRR